MLLTELVARYDSSSGTAGEPEAVEIPFSGLDVSGVINAGSDDHVLVVGRRPPEGDRVLASVALDGTVRYLATGLEADIVRIVPVRP